VSDYYQFRDETGTPIDYYRLVDDNNELCKEIERLSNIINELEKYLIEQVEKSWNNDYDNVLDKLDELKGSE